MSQLKTIPVVLDSQNEPIIEDLQLEILKMQEEGPDAFDSNNFKKVLYLVTAIAPKK